MGSNKGGKAETALDSKSVREVKPESKSASKPKRGKKLGPVSKPRKKSKSIKQQPRGPQQQVSSTKSKPKTKPKSKTTKKKAPIPRDAKGRFPLGVSGNPGGRKVGQLTLTGILRKLLEGKSKKKNCETVGEEIMKELLKHAKKGSPKLMQLIMNRIDGKLLDKVLQIDAYTPLKQATEEDIQKALKAAKEAEEESDAQ